MDVFQAPQTYYLQNKTHYLFTTASPIPEIGKEQHHWPIFVLPPLTSNSIPETPLETISISTTTTLACAAAFFFPRVTKFSN